LQRVLFSRFQRRQLEIAFQRRKDIKYLSAILSGAKKEIAFQRLKGSFQKKPQVSFE